MTELKILTDDRCVDSGLNIGDWAAVAEQTLQAEGIFSGELGLTFVSCEQMALLNDEHMGQSGPTDVLAFPMDLAEGEVVPDQVQADASLSVPLALGDVVICPEVAGRQASQHCGSLPAEMALLTIHGVLHVLGHDHHHPDERRVMQDREKVHMIRHGFRHPEFQ